MAGPAVALLKRCMANRVEQAFIRTTMSVMATITGVGARLNAFVNSCELGAGHSMTLCAKLTSFFINHAGFIGAMGLMALEAVFCRRSVDHPFAPELGNVCMAAEADDRLCFLENKVMRRAVSSMAGGTVFIHCRFVGKGGVQDDVVDITVTIQTELAGFLFYDIGIVSRVRRMTYVAVTLGYRFMGSDVFF